MTDTFEELHIMLSADGDSVITRDDQDELIEFLQDEWEPSGEYEAHLFEEEYDG
jgi:prenyltransferase beta subunit